VNPEYTPPLADLIQAVSKRFDSCIALAEDHDMERQCHLFKGIVESRQPLFFLKNSRTDRIEGPDH